MWRSICLILRRAAATRIAQRYFPSRPTTPTRRTLIGLSVKWAHRRAQRSCLRRTASRDGFSTREDVALRDVLRLPQPYIPPADIPDVKKEEIKPIVNAFLQHHLGPASGGAMIKFKRSDILGEAELVEAEVRGNISSSHRHALETTFLSTHDKNVPVSDEIQTDPASNFFFAIPFRFGAILHG